jgi:hypothetical protein
MKTNNKQTAAAVLDTAATEAQTLKERLNECQTFTEQIIVLAEEIELLKAKN